MASAPSEQIPATADYGRPAGPVATAADYERAVTMLRTNARRLLYDGPVVPRWLPEGRFTYRSATRAGARTWLVDPEAGTKTFLEDDEADGADKRPAATDPRWERPVAWAPDGRHGALVRNDDLWLVHVDGGERRLTHDGSPDQAYATEPDYARIIARLDGEFEPPAVLWSPDSGRFVTFRLDQRGVGLTHLLRSVPADGTLRPVHHSLHVAFPGDERVPLAGLAIVGATDGSIIWPDVPPLLSRGFSPIDKETVWWLADGATLYAIEESRDHQTVRLLAIDPVTGSSRLVLEEHGSTYLDLSLDRYPPSARTLKTGEVVWYSERDGWAHLYRYSGRPGDDVPVQITRGPWRVCDVVYLDEDQRLVYFTASGREPGFDPYWQLLYRVPLDGGEVELLTPEAATHDATVSPDGRWIVDVHSTLDRPPVSVLRSSDGTFRMELARTDADALFDLGWRPPERFSVRADDGATELFGNLYLPSALDPSRAYPVIEQHYPGPQSIDAPVAFRPDDTQALAELGFVVVRFDGRGTAGRSKAFHDAQYASAFGEAGFLRDSVAAITELARTRPWMDLTRVGIAGYSGGGFSAVRALITFPGFYRAAAAGGGNHCQGTTIARWGERYIGVPGPDASPEVMRGYDDGDNARHVQAIEGALFLYHGELDDDVPPANTLRLVDALIAANKDFDLLIVPGRDHEGAASDPYVMRRVWDFFVRTLQGGEPPRGVRLR